MNERLRIEPVASTVRHQVEDVLRKAIASGQFRPGEKLVERQLCEMTGVSRPSIREALRKLEAEGLINIVPHRGPTVAGMTVGEAWQIYAVRVLLEGFATQEFARLANDDQRRQLRQALRELERAGRPGGSGSLVGAKSIFYKIILDGCGNEIVRDVLYRLHNRVNVLRMTSMSQKNRLPRSLREIQQICERVEARDPEGARVAAALHVENAARAAIEVLARQEREMEHAEVKIPKRNAVKARIRRSITPKRRKGGKPRS